MDVPGVPGGQQLELELFQGNDFDLNNMQLPIIDALPFDLAVADAFPLNYDPLEEPPFGAFDIDQYINV
ncbi:hypothetical protein KXX64_002286 [Aspergillus fumigatus]|nr:hypothetical protein KXX64_002286 [Aspergillus fumigatus]